jgi:diguanylate cyclase (GGDEF)-like protein
VRPGERALTAQAERLQLLNQISRALTATLDLRVVFDTIYEQIGRVMDTSQFYVALHGPNHREIVVPYLWEEGRLLLDETIPYSNTITSYFVEHGSAFRYDTTEECERWERAHGLDILIIGEENSQSGIFVPLHTGHHLLGTLSVQTKRRYAYTDDDVQTLSVIASTAAIAIENASMYRQSQETYRQMQAVLRAATTVTASLDLQTVLNAILSSVNDVLPHYLAEIALPNVALGVFDIVAATGYHAYQRCTMLKLPLGPGFTSQVLSEGEPILLGDVRASPEFIADECGEGRSLLMVPLRRGEHTIGVLTLMREEVNGFAGRDIDLLRLFASQAGIAIENARLFEAERGRAEELAMIQSLVQQLEPLHESEEIVAAVQHELAGLVPYHTMRLQLLEDETLVPMAGGPRLRLGLGLEGWVAEQARAAYVPDMDRDYRTATVARVSAGPESMIAVPLLVESKVRGVLALTRLGTNSFTPAEQRLLEIVAAHVALTLDRARLYNVLRAEAVTDPLTGLYNRRALMERLSSEQARAERGGGELGAIVLDVDGFKRVNDIHGHEAGDVALQEIAQIVRATVRTADTVARWGGEEFAIVLPDATFEAARGVAERLREATAQQPLSVAGR